MKQRNLPYTEPPKHPPGAHARRPEILRSGHYCSIPLWLLERSDVHWAEKLVYAALLNHLVSDAVFWIYPSQRRLAAMTALTVRGVQKALAKLEARGLIEQRHRPASTSGIAFLSQEIPPAAAEERPTPRTEFVPPPELSSYPPRTEFVPLKHSADTKDTKKQRCAEQAPCHTAEEIAADWAHLLGLDEQTRSDEQVERDEALLTSWASKLLAGELGPPQRVDEAVQTRAHQIGHRRPPARKPLGMFVSELSNARRKLAEVRR